MQQLYSNQINLLSLHFICNCFIVYLNKILSIHFFKYMPFVCCFVHSHILHPFKINYMYLTLLVCFKCTCITKHILNSARNEILFTQLLNSCYYYSGREAAKYSTDPHMSGHRHGVAPYKEDPCGGLGQWGTVGVERT